MNKSQSRSQRKKRGKPNTSVVSYRWALTLLVGIAVVFIILAGNMRNNRHQLANESSGVLSDGQYKLGENVYQSNCAVCHGKNLEGQPDWQTRNFDGMLKAPPHDESGHTWHHGDQYLIERIKYGVETLDSATQRVSNMPAYRDSLTDAEIEAVLAFIRSSWPEDVQAIQAERTQAEVDSK